MKSKRSRLLLSLCTLMFCVAVMCFGVYAATSVEYTLSGHISYDVSDDVFVDVDTTLYASSESTLLDSKANLAQNMEDIVTKLESDATVSSVSLAKQTYSDHESTYNNGLGSEIDSTAQFYGEPLDLEFGSYVKDTSSYAYYIAITVKNYGSGEINAILNLDSLYSDTSNVIITPYRTMANISAKQGEEPSIVAFVFGLVLKDSSSSVNFTFDNVSLSVNKGNLDQYVVDSEFGFTQSPDGNYLVSSYTGSDTKVIIPSTHQGQDVVGIADTTTSSPIFSTSLQEVYLPQSIEHIGDYAFNKRSSLRYINLPENVNYIGRMAFMGCSNLNYVTFPQHVEIINQSAFAQCSLVSVIVPTSDFSGSAMFNGNTSLVSATLRDGCTMLSNGMFLLCSSLNYVEIPDSVILIESASLGTSSGNGNANTPFYKDIIENKNGIYTNSNGTKFLFKAQNVGTTFDLSPYQAIAGEAFQDCTTLEEITIPNTIKAIGGSTFNGCTNLSTVEIGTGVEYIGSRAFNDCTSLNEIVIPNNVKYLLNRVFDGSNLSSVTLGKRLIYIGGSVFDGTSWLSTVESSGGIVTASDGTTKYAISVTTQESTVSLDGVRAIATQAFSNCENLTSITIPESVVGIGYRAFPDTLTKITIQGNSNWQMLNSGLAIYVDSINSSDVDIDKYEEFGNVWIKSDSAKLF